MKNLIAQLTKRIFGIAGLSLLIGLFLMVLGNTSMGSHYGFLSLTLAPCLIILGYVLIGIGILKRIG